MTERGDNVVELPLREPENDFAQNMRLAEALLFAAREPLEDAILRSRLPAQADLAAILDRLAEHYRGRGVHLVRVANGWAFRTAPDLAERLRVETPVSRKLTRAAIETLSIVAYHQPVTRAEIENIRGVATSKGTLDTLMEAGWIRPGRRRMTPGKPLTWITTKAFLDHFGLAAIDELPGLEELKAAGLLDSRAAVATLPGAQIDADDDGDDGSDAVHIEADDEGGQVQAEA